MSGPAARPASAAVIGTGFVGAQHVEALRRIGVDVAVVVASAHDRARTAAEGLGVRRWTADWGSAVSDRGIDVVHVCVPNDLHRPVVLAALAAGKHVVCEKPLALDLAQGRELADAAGRSDRVAVLCHNYRFFPMVAELRLRVAAGVLGRVHSLRGAYLQDWLVSADATNWRIDAARGGRSRTIADIGTHWVDLAETVAQCRLEAVLAELATIHPRRPAHAHAQTFTASADAADDWVDVDTEDQAGLLLRFEGGVTGVLSLSQVAAGHSNDLELSIDGAAGSATWRQEEPDQLRLARNGTVEVIARSPDGLSPGARQLARLPAGHNEGWADALRNLLAAAYGAVRRDRIADEAGAAPIPTFDDGVRHLAFVEAALQSATAGSWVSIDEVLNQRPSAAEVS
ncbi:MAG TPA: Gfo/Idh/MocA family oxidoreductase [Candidatus Limnocylindria bacterium]